VCTRLAVACDKAYQLLVHGRWFSPGTPASSTTKAGRHDIAEILLKVALNTKNNCLTINVYFSPVFIGLMVFLVKFILTCFYDLFNLIFGV
jgi:hypothetical protein